MASTSPRVGIVMGSKSDWPAMKGAKDVLDHFDVGAEVRVLSAHRTPEAANTYAREAEERGLQVLIAGAGGAAHLPGVLAANTLLPVLGVPMANGPLQGVDALLAIVQMPRGIPVATLGIGRADNAALLAIALLALADGELRERLAAYRREMTAAAVEVDRALQQEL